jgi:hypothetical protein
MISDINNDIVIGTYRLDRQKIVYHTIKYIDDTIYNFPQWLKNSNIPFSSKENTLNTKLAEFLSNLESKDLIINNLRFSFTNQPASSSQYTSDIGVCLMDKLSSSEYLFYLEGKRLPARDKKHEREYVCGKLGGIQRFKENKHGKNLPSSAMVGYVQKETFNVWQDKINNWIDDLIESEDSLWNDSDKIVIFNNRNDKFSSKHNRIDGNEPIILYHYWIDLTEED